MMIPLPTGPAGPAVVALPLPVLAAEPDVEPDVEGKTESSVLLPQAVATMPSAATKESDRVEAKRM